MFKIMFCEFMHENNSFEYEFVLGLAGLKLKHSMMKHYLHLKPKFKELVLTLIWIKSNVQVVCVCLTFEGFRWCFSRAGCLWNEHTLSKHLNIEACIVKWHLGVFLQLLGQVGSRRGGHCVGPVAAILRDLQLFHKTHGPGGKSWSICFIPELTWTNSRCMYSI